MSAYADTSHLVTWLTGAGPQPAALMLVHRWRPLLWTPWQEVEFTNAVRQAVFRRKLPVAILPAIDAALRAALDSGDLRFVDLPDGALWAEAARLSAAHTLSTGVRTLDLLHVAAARVVGASDFLTFDDRQHALARAAGLTVHP